MATQCTSSDTQGPTPVAQALTSLFNGCGVVALPWSALSSSTNSFAARASAESWPSAAARPSHASPWQPARSCLWRCQSLRAVNRSASDRQTECELCTTWDMAPAPLCAPPQFGHVKDTPSPFAGGCRGVAPSSARRLCSALVSRGRAATSVLWGTSPTTLLGLALRGGVNVAVARVCAKGSTLGVAPGRL